jgi:hypothetical protein
MKSRQLRHAAGTIALLLASGLAHAVPITWEASGALTNVQNFGGTYLPFAATVGDAFTFRFTFEDTTPDTSLYASVAAYHALVSARVTVAGVSFELPVIDPKSTITVQNDQGVLDPRDRFTVAADAGTNGNGLGAYLANIYMLTPPLGEPSSALTSQNLPLSPPDPSLFAYRSFSLQYLDSVVDTEEYYYRGSWIEGRVDSFSEVQSVSVPEPSSFGLFAIALSGFALLRRRRPCN